MRIVLMMSLALTAAFAQDEIALRGLAVYEGDNEMNFPVIIRAQKEQRGKAIRNSGRMTIQFDVLAAEPPSLKIKFFHCNRNWTADNNLFVNDINHNTSFYLSYETSPGGVQGYSYRYINSFPDAEDAVRFEFAGNWIFRIMDTKERTTYAESRFFVVDDIAATRVEVTNDYLTANASPYNQIHKVEVHTSLPDEIEGYYYTTVDVYQNKRVHHPFRIDMWDRDPYTIVKGEGTGERLFTVANIMPGNDYRTFDFSSTTRYPNRALVKNVQGADQMRPYWRTGEDHAGTTSLNRFTGLNSDYQEVLFRLDMTATDYRLATIGGKDIYLVGPFNFWNPTTNDKLVFDENERSYVVKLLLRRGIYDYQYIAGTWDEKTQQVINQDWLSIEGNDWRTTNTYRAMVYYNDPRFGGCDRIVGYGIGESKRELRGTN